MSDTETENDRHQRSEEMVAVLEAAIRHARLPMLTSMSAVYHRDVPAAGRVYLGSLTLPDAAEWAAYLTSHARCMGFLRDAEGRSLAATVMRELGLSLVAPDGLYVVRKGLDQ